MARLRGVFVSNDGVHVYNDQGLVHEDVMPLIKRGAQQRAEAAEAVARAKVDVAARGLNATVIQNFYAIADAMRKLDNATLSVTEARQFVDITQKQETGGEVAHADVVKAQLQLQQRQIDLNEAQVTLAKAKIALAVLIFPDLTDRLFDQRRSGSGRSAACCCRKQRARQRRAIRT